MRKDKVNFSQLMLTDCLLLSMQWDQVLITLLNVLLGLTLWNYWSGVQLKNMFQVDIPKMNLKQCKCSIPILLSQDLKKNKLNKNGDENILSLRPSILLYEDTNHSLSTFTISMLEKLVIQNQDKSLPFTWMSLTIYANNQVF